MFETLKAFDAHLPCKRPTQWKEPKFKDVGGEEPTLVTPTFNDPEFEESGQMIWAGETTRDRVDSHLRSRRIRALLADPPPPAPTRFERLKAWLKK